MISAREVQQKAAKRVQRKEVRKANPKREPHQKRRAKRLLQVVRVKGKVVRRQVKARKKMKVTMMTK
jgi:hypothetical protein